MKKEVNWKYQDGFSKIELLSEQQGQVGTVSNKKATQFLEWLGIAKLPYYSKLQPNFVKLRIEVVNHSLKTSIYNLYGRCERIKK